jgi:hypothetical protein
MFGLSKPRLPRLTVIGRALVAAVGVVALVGAGSSIAAGVSTSPQVASSSSVYVPLTPTRVLDTRVGNGLPGRLLANTPATFQVAGRSGSGIASDATAVTGNVTVVNPTNSWAVYLGPDPIANPTTSTINFTSGEVVGNGLIVALSATGTLSATYMSTAGNTTDLVFDVTGYFVAGAGAQGPAGPQGPKGDTGDTGATGDTGPAGAKGDKGDTGATGAQGPKGDTGATGAAGPAAGSACPTSQSISGGTNGQIFEPSEAQYWPLDGNNADGSGTFSGVAQTVYCPGSLGTIIVTISQPAGNAFHITLWVNGEEEGMNSSEYNGESTYTIVPWISTLSPGDKVAIQGEASQGSGSAATWTATYTVTPTVPIH